MIKIGKHQLRGTSFYLSRDWSSNFTRTQGHRNTANDSFCSYFMWESLPSYILDLNYFPLLLIITTGIVFTVLPIRRWDGITGTWSSFRIINFWHHKHGSRKLQVVVFCSIWRQRVRNVTFLIHGDNEIVLKEGPSKTLRIVWFWRVFPFHWNTDKRFVITLTTKDIILWKTEKNRFNWEKIFYKFKWSQKHFLSYIYYIV